MKKYTRIIAFVTATVLIFSGCGGSSKPDEEANVESETLIQVTREQFSADSMVIGEVIRRNFEDEVTCNGLITAPANGIAQISTPVSGIIESIHCAMGDNVRKGQILAMISSNELMAIQQEFTESSAKLKRLKLDYERSKSLYDEKIGSEKDFISTESEYKSMLSKYNSLKLRLEILKLDISKIEAGNLYAEFPLISPISGHITSQNMVLGQFTEQQKSLVEIIDISQLQLQLSVFENDADKLKIGQTVRFNTLGNKSLCNFATIASISRTINPETKTILCIARIASNEGINLINHSYVEARIALNKREANALPSEAILKSGKEYFVFVVEKSDNQSYSLQKMRVEIGAVSDGYTEITGNPSLTKVLVKGVYNLPVQ
jgi:cobalt-zinc-cadmium efflux system membrane fusion protein